MKVNWRRKSKSKEDILKRDIKIVEDYNNNVPIEVISKKNGFKDIRQVFVILNKMEKIEVPGKE
jgi:hypothetical protein